MSKNEADWKALVDRRDKLNGIRGKRVGGEPRRAEHFYTCPTCGQSVDKGDLSAVLHREQEDHEPLPTQLKKAPPRSRQPDKEKAASTL